MYVCLVHMHTRMPHACHKHTHACTHTDAHTRMHTHGCAHTDARTRMRAHGCAHTDARTRMRAHGCAHTDACTCTRTHTHFWQNVIVKNTFMLFMLFTFLIFHLTPDLVLANQCLCVLACVCTCMCIYLKLIIHICRLVSM